jgi:Ca-activated chloride channel family protein
MVIISSVGGVSANGVIAEPTVEKTASPTSIDLAGSGGSEYTTVTLTVTGAGSSTTTSVPLDVVFAIDSSGSMGWNDPSDLRKTAAKSFIDKMDSSKDQAGVVSWDDNLDFAKGLSDNFTFIKNWVDNVDSSGGTNLDVGLINSISMLDNTGQAVSAKVIVFLSDGSGTYSHAYAQSAADKGYVIYSIGLGSSVNTVPLIDMATTTGGQYYSAPTAANLDAIYQEIYSEVASSTIPYNVTVTEITQDYIVDEGSYNIAPDSITTVSGQTVIVWEDIGMINDADSDMSADEVVVLSFMAKSSQCGANLPVDVVPDAKVCYDDKDGNFAGCVEIPQAYIDVCEDNGEIPEFPTIAVPVIGIIGLALFFQRRK